MLETDEQRNQRMLNFSNKKVEVFVKYCEVALDKKLTYNELSYLSDLDSPWGLNFDGVTVVADEDFNEFEVGYEKYNPGGRWEPPDVEYVTDSTYKELDEALWRVLVVWLQHDYRGWLESQWVEECVTELEDYE
jgi:hypothetical protein